MDQLQDTEPPYQRWIDIQHDPGSLSDPLLTPLHLPMPIHRPVLYRRGCFVNSYRAAMDDIEMVLTDLFEKYPRISSEADFQNMVFEQIVSAFLDKMESRRQIHYLDRRGLLMPHERHEVHFIPTAIKRILSDWEELGTVQRLRDRMDALGESNRLKRSSVLAGASGRDSSSQALSDDYLSSRSLDPTVKLEEDDILRAIPALDAERGRLGPDSMGDTLEPETLEAAAERSEPEQSRMVHDPDDPAGRRSPPASARPAKKSRSSANSNRDGASIPDFVLYLETLTRAYIFLIIELKWVAVPKLSANEKRFPFSVFPHSMIAFAWYIRQAIYQTLRYMYCVHASATHQPNRLGIAQVNETFSRVLLVGPNTFAIETPGASIPSGPISFAEFEQRFDWSRLAHSFFSHQQPDQSSESGASDIQATAIGSEGGKEVYLDSLAIAAFCRYIFTGLFEAGTYESDNSDTADKGFVPNADFAAPLLPNHVKLDLDDETAVDVQLSLDKARSSGESAKSRQKQKHVDKIQDVTIREEDDTDDADESGRRREHRRAGGRDGIAGIGASGLSAPLQALGGSKHGAGGAMDIEDGHTSCRSLGSDGENHQEPEPDVERAESLGETSLWADRDFLADIPDLKIILVSSSHLDYLADQHLKHVQQTSGYRDSSASPVPPLTPTSTSHQSDADTTLQSPEHVLRLSEQRSVESMAGTGGSEQGTSDQGHLAKHSLTSPPAGRRLEL